MNPLTILPLAFAPGLFWLWQIYLQDRLRPQPKGLVLRTFILGAAVSLPIAIIEAALILPVLGGTPFRSFLLRPGNLLGLAYVAFIGAGLTEEMGKYLVVRHSIYDSPYFTDPASGIVYASATALGFASLENVGYLFVFGWEAILVRGPISTLAHVFFSAAWGFPLGWQKTRQGRWRWLARAGLGTAMALHGLFDFLLFTHSDYSILAFPVFLGTGGAFILSLSYSRRLSPYRGQVAAVIFPCPRCGQESAAGAVFCVSCGAHLADPSQKDQGRCSHCGAPQSPQANFCTTCGFRLNRKLVKAP